MTRRTWLLAAAGIPLLAMPDQKFSFSVFSLFHPKELLLRPARHSRLHTSTKRTLEGGQTLSFQLDAPLTMISGPDGAAAWFALSVPGRIEREYYGTLEVRTLPNELRAVIDMDRETAVSSIVGAELAVDSAPAAAMAAQAVATRSFLLGGRRHAGFDFCDTTHCQFLRSPAKPDSVVDQAVSKTDRFVLSRRGRVFAASYSAACGHCEVCRRRGTIQRGHGKGLCQEGAIVLAGEGRSWQQILATYYPGSRLERLR